MDTQTEVNLLQTLNAYHNCLKSNNQLWLDKHEETIEDALLDSLPHGSGIDADWQIDILDNCISCHNSYHRMNGDGFYCEWIDFVVRIKANYRDMFGKLIITIYGKFGRHQDIKDSLYEIVQEGLNEL